MIEKCWSKDPDERPTFEEIAYNLKMNNEFITSKVIKEDYLKYIDHIDLQIKQNSNQKINEKESKIDEMNFILEDQNNVHLSTVNEQQNDFNHLSNEILSIIDEYFKANNAKDLMCYINMNCSNEQISLIFNRILLDSKEFYIELCKEGIILNNAVAHHKYAISLILDQYDSESDINKVQNYKKANEHLKMSIDYGFIFSYFVQARLYYEIIKDFKAAFLSAKKGSDKGEKYCKCLLGYFIAHGIGTKKEFSKGISIILDSNAEDFYKIFANDIGIYYYEIKDENKVFYWFEKAFLEKQTKATINNYGLCFLRGIGITKNYEKAKEIFTIGLHMNDANSMYHLAFIFEETKPDYSLELYKKAAKQGHLYSQIKYASIISKTKPEKSIKYFKLSADKGDSESQYYLANLLAKKDHDLSLNYYKKAAEGGNIKAQEYLARKYSIENDSENTYKYIYSLINTGNHSVPIEYALNLYKLKKFKQSFNIFSTISSFNNPIAKYYIGIMKYRGDGCDKNTQESYKILKYLSDHGIDKATDFIKNHFDKK